MVFNQEKWDKYLKGYLIYDAVISKQGRYWLLLVENTDDPHRDPLPRTRFLSINVNREMDKRFGLGETGDFDFTRMAFTRGDVTEVVAVDIGGFVYSYDAQRHGAENNHPRKMEGSDKEGHAINKVVRVGSAIYSVCGFRRCYKRLGMNQWQNITANLPIPPAAFNKKLNPADVSWRDLAGFSESDMYAVGGVGDVWHFDGEQWTQCDFPSNELLKNVACASDGNVYIGGNMGSLWVGKKDSWKRIAKGNFSIHWKDITWFAGKLWLGSDYGLWELKDGSIERADVPADVQACAGALDISPDNSLMLTAGLNGAALFDGEEWQVLFNRNDFEGTFYG